MIRRSLVILLVLILFIPVYVKASAFCDTDCDDLSEFKYPCLGGMCKGYDPRIRIPCLGAKELACRQWENMKKGVVDNMAHMVASNTAVVDAAKGWTTSTCVASGSALIIAISAGYGALICSTIGASTLGVGLASCAIFLGASGTLIVGATCSQLCTDKHLSDCN